MKYQSFSIEQRNNAEHKERMGKKKQNARNTAIEQQRVHRRTPPPKKKQSKANEVLISYKEINSSTSSSFPERLSNFKISKTNLKMS